jgi:hypothetical protein
MPTIPTVQDFHNAKDDADDLAEIVNGNGLAVVATRYGGDKPSVQRAMEQALLRYGTINNRGAWQAATEYATNDIWQHTDSTWYLVVTGYMSNSGIDVDAASENVVIYQNGLQEPETDFSGDINVNLLEIGFESTDATANVTNLSAAITEYQGRTLKIHQAFYVDSTIDLSGVNLTAVSAGLKAANGMTAPVAKITNASSTDSHIVDVRITGNGAGRVLADSCDGLLIDDDRSPLCNYVARVSYCNYGVIANSDTEKKRIDVHAAYCAVAYAEQIVSGGSPDELIVTLSATRCTKWYETEGEVSSHVRFNVESNIDTFDPDHYVVTNKGGKSITLAGEIRGTKNGCIKLTKVETGVTTWQDATHFDDLKLIQVDKGIALYMERCQRITGQIVMYDCQNNNGPTMFIGEVQDLGGFRAFVNKCFSLYGVQLGNSETAPDALELVLSISMGDVYSTQPSALTALYIYSADTCNITLELCEGNILLDGATGCTLTIPSRFAQNAYTITGGNKTTHVIIKGKLSMAEAASISWLNNVASVTIQVLKEHGGPVVYADSVWNLPRTLTANVLDYECRNSDINGFFKKAGLSVFNKDTNQSYTAISSNYAGAWVDYSSSTYKTPTLQTESNTLFARLPNDPLEVEKNLYDRLIYDLKVAGIYSKIPCLYIFMTSNKSNALQNIMQDTYHLTEVNGVKTHTLYQSLSGGLGAYLDTGYNVFNELGGRSWSMGSLCIASDSDPEQDMETANSYGRLRCRSGSGSYVRMGSDDADQLGMLSTTSPKGGLRLVSGTITGTTQTIYADGNLSNTNEVSNPLTPSVMHISRSTREIGAAYIAEYLTDLEVSALSNALHTYRINAAAYS